MAQGAAYVRTVRWDTDRDGKIDNVQVTNYWTDDNGNVLKEVAETDSNYDGKIDFTLTTTREFYASGLVKSELREFDNLNEDRFDNASLSEFRYDGNGEQVWFRSSSDFNADGTWDETYTQESTLDDKGRVTESFSYTDWDSNGEPDAVVRSVYQYDENGMQVFLGHYLDGSETPYYSDEVVMLA